MKNIRVVHLKIKIQVCIYLLGGHFFLPTSALLVPFTLNQLRRDFEYNYSVICARNSVNGNTVTHTLTVSATEN